MRRGDAAVTAFSGARQMGEVRPDLHPLDLTFIDPNGATLQVFDLTELGGAADGQVARAPIKFKAKAGEIGQVYGVQEEGLEVGRQTLPAAAERGSPAEHGPPVRH